jgi:hypothetical protein
LALDGNALKKTFDAFNDFKARQFLSAFATDSALVLAHIEIDQKSNEIPAAQKLFEEIALANRLVTLDAMRCKKTFEAAAVNADLIVQLKENQPSLHGRVEDQCRKEPPPWTRK